MLAELRIKNFVLIDQLSLSFGAGLNILSGETGAGKSIILGALNQLLGGRSSPEMLREGADEAIVEGLFQIDDEPWVAALLERFGLEPADELWIRRTIPRNGRGRIFLNGGPVPLAVLRSLAGGLIDFSSQNEHQVLLNPETHLDILDAYGNLAGLRDRMASASTALRDALTERDTLLSRQRTRVEREEFLRFQISELERLNPQAGEDEALEAERRLLSHSEKLFASAQSIEQSLYSGRGAVVETLGDALRKLQEMSGIDPNLEPQVQSLQTALYAAEDVSRTLGGYARKIQFNPARLEEIGARQADLSQLKRKYRMDLAGIAARFQEMKVELASLTGAEDRLEELEIELRKHWAEAKRVAGELTGARQDAARALERTTEAELRSLSMPRARFLIQVTAKADLEGAPDLERAPGPLGNDRVEFYLSANVGESPRPLAKVASGGELSRILLAVKRALAGAGEVGTFVFDEVDAGIGGAVAEVVGRKLREIADHRQLLCITHLAQIAAYADRHFTVEKQVVAGRTRSQVTQLTPEDRVEEIARMLGGLEITERTREHARELIERCEAFRTSRGEAVCPS